MLICVVFGELAEQRFASGLGLVSLTAVQWDSCNWGFVHLAHCAWAGVHDIRLWFGGVGHDSAWLRF